MTLYEPLEKVRKELKVKWIRPRVDAETLRRLNERSNPQGWFQAGGHLALWLVTGAVVYYFWTQSMWLAFSIALFCHGTAPSYPVQPQRASTELNARLLIPIAWKISIDTPPSAQPN